MALVCSLRGSVCLYQGEELGLAESDVPFEALRDPYGIAFWPSFKGRDGCRTPMPWNGGAHAGFSAAAAPWLPVDAGHAARSVAVQEADPESVLHAARTFLRWRKAQPALVRGAIRFLDAPEPVLAFVREDDGQRVLVVFNLSGDNVAWSPPADLSPQLLDVPGIAAARIEGARIVLPPRGALFASV